MNIEIERKFLVDLNWEYHASSYIEQSYLITQGYIAKTDKSVTRIRVANNVGWLCIKDKGTMENGVLARREFEYEIPLEDAKQLLELCPSLVRKTRTIVNWFGDLWEVNKYVGVAIPIAEIELKDSTQQIVVPFWCMQEVTGDSRFFDTSFAP